MDNVHAFDRSLQQELEEAFSTGLIYDYEVHHPEHIIQAIEHNYIEGESRAWWMALKHRVYKQHEDQEQSYATSKDIIQRYAAPDLRTNQKLLFIIDEDNERHHVYKLTLDEIIYVIAECRFFEYYICPDEYSWLLCENEHGEFLVCKRS